MVRTALFNWAYARHTGGTFVFRIEDTDSARDTEESYQALLDALRWLGLDWDEGPEVGGPFAPYRQSQRLDVYRDVAGRLLAAGLAYESFSTPDEVEARRRAAGQDPKLGYDNADRHLTDEQKASFRAEGRQPVLRLRMPERTWAWDDLVRGRLEFGHQHVPDFVITRGNGEPLYTLVNPVDDVLMRITHVLRGEDLLASTPRQLAMYEALDAIGVGNGWLPRFGHLPYVMGEGNKKLSKRDPQSALDHYRHEGYLPEGLVNYLALLGWSPGENREFFSQAEMAEVFDVVDVSENPARFDIKKCTAVNADWIRALEPADLAGRLVPFLRVAGLVGDDLDDEQREHPGGGRAVGAGAHGGALAGRRDARVPVRAGGPLRGRPGGRGDARGEGPADARGGARGADGARRVGHPGHRGGAARRAHRRPRAQAEAGVRPGAGRGDRAAGVAAAVRVVGDPRPRCHAAAAVGRPRVTARCRRRGFGRWPAPCYPCRAPARKGSETHGVWGNWQPDGFWLR